MHEAGSGGHLCAATAGKKKIASGELSRERESGDALKKKTLRRVFSDFRCESGTVNQKRFAPEKGDPSRVTFGVPGGTACLLFFLALSLSGVMQEYLEVRRARP